MRSSRAGFDRAVLQGFGLPGSTQEGRAVGMLSSRGQSARRGPALGPVPVLASQLGSTRHGEWPQVAPSADSRPCHGLCDGPWHGLCTDHV